MLSNAIAVTAVAARTFSQFAVCEGVYVSGNAGRSLSAHCTLLLGMMKR